MTHQVTADEPLRIAQLAPLAESVPPKLYGGTERVVSWLTEELVSLGHRVTLLASGESQTRGTLVPVWPRAIRLSRRRPDPAAAYAAQLQQLAEVAGEFDIIHCHVDWGHLPLLSWLQVPFLTTLHGRLDLPHLDTALAHFPDAPFVSISNSQRRPLPNVNWLSTIHHGLPKDLFPLSLEPENYLAYLGRISVEKGPERAIRMARAAELPLKMAAKIPKDENRYFAQRVRPLLDGNNVQFVGEVDDRSKSAFLGKALALLFPIDWPEPFGLVMIEAMACGTPVVAWPRGSVPEIIEDGVNGFIVDSESAAVDAIRRVRHLDRRKVRQAFERRFTASRMAQDYVAAYRALVASPFAGIARTRDQRATARASLRAGLEQFVAVPNQNGRDRSG
jgi:glycosyltransferase involved in cell wall biosynthesis